jgi:tartrate dehydratase alpha subunit/fumarate hydratase class I-like protein
MSVIREDDVIASVADALQYISYYHTPDFIRAMGRAYAIEQNPAARLSESRQQAARIHRVRSGLQAGQHAR